MEAQKPNVPVEKGFLHSLGAKIVSILVGGQNVRVAQPVVENQGPNRAERRQEKQAPHGRSRNRKNTPGRKAQHESIMMPVETPYGKVSQKTGYTKLINHKIVKQKEVHSRYGHMNRTYESRQPKEVKDEIRAANNMGQDKKLDKNAGKSANRKKSNHTKKGD